MLLLRKLEVIRAGYFCDRARRLFSRLVHPCESCSREQPLRYIQVTSLFFFDSLCFPSPLPCFLISKLVPIIINLLLLISLLSSSARLIGERRGEHLALRLGSRDVNTSSCSRAVSRAVSHASAIGPCPALARLSPRPALVSTTAVNKWSSPPR